MKTIKFRLLATIFTLAAVITTANTLNAQRRSTGSSARSEQTEKISNGRGETVKQKSGSLNNAYEKKAADREIRNPNEIKRSSSAQKNESKNNSNSFREKSKQPQSTQRSGNERAERGNQNQIKSGSNQNSNFSRNTDTKESVRRSVGSAERSTRENYNTDRSGRSERISGVSNRERYHLDDNDYRYRPNENYRGGKNYWSSEIRGNGHDNSKKYSYRNFHHWDNRWENYRWNQNSWRNYYSYYDPYSYRHHKYYFHHSYYGHVIKRFVYKPAVFIHNHNRYYCYDGHFFRYRPGIGYILVDIPFGMYFEYIPDDYEMVRINGYLYFRVGNLFFEHTRTGYELVHYPERYYAFDDNYYNGGFRFEITVN